jgi:hypothetical protein
VEKWAGDPQVTARIALAALIGLATLVACDVPVDATSFVQEITRLLKP